jgi:hypothetical protein
MIRVALAPEYSAPEQIPPDDAVNESTGRVEGSATRSGSWRMGAADVAPEPVPSGNSPD